MSDVAFQECDGKLIQVSIGVLGQDRSAIVVINHHPHHHQIQCTACRKLSSSARSLRRHGAEGSAEGSEAQGSAVSADSRRAGGAPRHTGAPHPHRGGVRRARFCRTPD